MYLGDLWLDHGIVKMPRKALCRRFVNVEYLVWIFFLWWAICNCII